ncbi:hypothetical protein [Microcoleus sp. herbarium2]|uniref:hypothetical protein n=1 Tax=Microcoleus sp. herbarium2 TaxID=3055433 RepID=UPI002FD4030B
MTTKNLFSLNFLVGFNRMQAISPGVLTPDGLNGSVQDIITNNFGKEEYLFYVANGLS